MPKKKTTKKLKILSIEDPYPQEDIIGQLTALLEEAKAGKIANMVIYRELKTGEYSIHTTPSEDTTKVAANLMQMAFIRFGLHH
jgi:hypothetical protein